MLIFLMNGNLTYLGYLKLFADELNELKKWFNPDKIIIYVLFSVYNIILKIFRLILRRTYLYFSNTHLLAVLIYMAIVIIYEIIF